MPTVNMLKKGMLTFFMGSLALILLLPILLIFTNSLMTDREMRFNYSPIGQHYQAEEGREPPFANLKLLPDHVTLKQYGKVLIESPTFLRMFWNSLFLVLPMIVGQVCVAALAAYALAKLKFPGRDALFLVYLMSMLMPFQVTLVPNYIMAEKLGMLNSVHAIVFPGIFAAFGVFMLRQFMLHIPYAYIEAAKMDGASHIRTYLMIILPMIKPGISALVVLLFVDYWNMVEQPVIFLNDPFKQPLSVYLSRINQDELGIAFAASMLYMTPMLLLFLYAESSFIEGIQLSGLKG